MTTEKKITTSGLKFAFIFICILAILAIWYNVSKDFKTYQCKNIQKSEYKTVIELTNGDKMIVPNSAIYSEQAVSDYFEIVVNENRSSNIARILLVTFTLLFAGFAFAIYFTLYMFRLADYFKYRKFP